MENKWLGILYLVIVSDFCMVRAFNEYEDSLTKSNEDKSKVQVRSVFVNCQSEAENAPPDSDATRFEQHELFKHSALKNCVKKLTVTVKINSESDNSGDEYLPIEHVFEGSNQKRFRLLDPYILRLRRELPLQAYKLRKLEIVSGVLLDYPRKETRARVQRDVDVSIEGDPEIRSSESHQLQPPSPSTTEIVNDLKNCEKDHNCRSHNKIIERYKRSDRNVLVEAGLHSNTNWASKDHSYRDRKKHSNYYDNNEELHETEHKPVKLNTKKGNIENENAAPKTGQRKLRFAGRTVTKSKEIKVESQQQSDSSVTTEQTTSGKSNKNDRPKAEINGRSVEKPYEIYDIGTPQVWYNVHVQLFEKLGTPDGKTVWNDLTKGNIASVSSIAPEWTGPDLNVRYRSTKWIPREDFTLPSNRLCLLVSSDNEIAESESNSSSFDDGFDKAKYIVIPEEDIMDLKDDVKKRSDNTSESDTETAANSSDSVEQKYRKVAIRLTRSILKENEDNPNMTSQGKEKYLTLRHRRPYSVQIDLEARADENELVHVGSSGRISIAVADSTRRTRTILNLQVGNTGLAAANFRVAARDFDPILSDLVKDKDATIAGPILIPPRHTRSLHLELPVELPVDVARCSVSLINDQDQSVAVRDIAIKKGDRCFCVWHCECVCLSDDPRLICRDMDETRSKAAGLSTGDRPRHARSICYCDVQSLNIFVMFTGVLFTLILLGLVKAIVGLFCRCIGNLGLPYLLQTPRKLDQYYEAALKDYPVEFDDENWPIHPETKQRSVRLVSLPMELMLNTIFFVCLPCILAYEGGKKMILYWQIINGTHKDEADESSPNSPSVQNKDTSLYSTHDMQAAMPRRRRPRDGLRRWMSPQAQKLSKELWRKSRNMQPLLRAHRSREVVDISLDSEQDDTEYVLTQMQKSRESLARSQKKMVDLDPSRLALASNKELLY